MFGLSWIQIGIIVLVAVFVLGPERLPIAVRWVVDGLRRARLMADGARTQLHREFGPELDELRRQVNELQSLKDVKELRDLRDLHPNRLLDTYLRAEPAGSTTSSADSATNGRATTGLSLEKKATAQKVGIAHTHSANIRHTRSEALRSSTEPSSVSGVTAKSGENPTLRG